MNETQQGGKSPTGERGDGWPENEPPVEGAARGYDAPWNSTKASMPDDETTVLIHAPNESEPVMLGYHDGEWDCWRDMHHMRFTNKEVTHWVDLPNPPRRHNDRHQR